MNALSDKRNHLRRAMQKAYAEWMIVSELPGTQAGAGDAVKTKWSAYVAAKTRLVAAYAEQPAAG